MKRLLAVILLFVLVFSRTEVSQLVKVPVLVQHYFEHLKLDKTISFMKFMAMHYQDAGHNDDPSHHNLPFKAHQCHHFVQIDVLDFYMPSVALDIAQEYKAKPVYQEDFYHSTLLSSIWQPPQA